MPELIVCDASFISAMKVLKSPLSLAARHAELIALVKPQFEVGKSGIGRGGLVKSMDLSQQALARVSKWVAEQGWDRYDYPTLRLEIIQLGRLPFVRVEPYRTLRPKKRPNPTC